MGTGQDELWELLEAAGLRVLQLNVHTRTVTNHREGRAMRRRWVQAKAVRPVDASSSPLVAMRPSIAARERKHASQADLDSSRSGEEMISSAPDSSSSGQPAEPSQHTRGALAGESRLCQPAEIRQDAHGASVGTSSLCQPAGISQAARGASVGASSSDRPAGTSQDAHEASVGQSSLDRSGNFGQHAPGISATSSSSRQPDAGVTGSSRPSHPDAEAGAVSDQTAAGMSADGGQHEGAQPDGQAGEGGIAEWDDEGQEGMGLVNLFGHPDLQVTDTRRCF